MCSRPIWSICDCCSSGLSKRCDAESAWLWCANKQAADPACSAARGSRLEAAFLVRDVELRLEYREHHVGIRHAAVGRVSTENSIGQYFRGRETSPRRGVVRLTSDRDGQACYDSESLCQQHSGAVTVQGSVQIKPSGVPCDACSGGSASNAPRIGSGWSRKTSGSAANWQTVSGS